MDNAGYTTLTRQAGLRREMASVANNIANLSTTGFRRQGVMFSEHVEALGDGSDSLSMATADLRRLDTDQGPLSKTGGRFDLAIEGEGYFLIESGQGNQLTRAGNFVRNSAGELATPDGHRLLDIGGAPVFVPPDATDVAVAADGTVTADGRPLTQIGLFRPSDATEMQRHAGTRFSVDSGASPMAPDRVRILQGFVEDSNVDPIAEVARMIEVQRAYQQGQNFLTNEDDRIRSVIRTLGR